MLHQANPLYRLLADQGVVILDGAQGTELERRGINIGGSKLWSAQLLIDDPDTVRAIHLDYLRAGSDVITTFTYQASLPGFAEAGVDAHRAGRLLNLAVDLAEQARAQFLAKQQQQQQQQQGEGQQQGKDQEQGQGQGQEAQAAAQGQCGAEGQGSGRQEGAKNTSTAASEAAGVTGVEGGGDDGCRGRGQAAAPRGRPLIAYSCGSYGAYLADGSEFRGDYADSVSMEDLMAFHRTRLDPVRSRPEIDLIAFETVPCLKEAEAIVQLLRQERYGKPAWISFSCKDDGHTCHGEDFGSGCIPLLAAAAAEGLVAAAGVNCTAPRYVPALLAAARKQLQQRADTEATTATAGGATAAAAALPSPPQPPLLLLCYPNSGEQWDGVGRCWHSDPDDIAEPGRFAAAAAEWVRRGGMGASLVGGCCRTGPAHIAALRSRLVHPDATATTAAAAAGASPGAAPAQ